MSKNTQKVNDLTKGDTNEIQSVEQDSTLEVEICRVGPEKSSSPRRKPSPLRTQHQPTVLISEGEDIEERTEVYSSFESNRRQRTWETSSRSFIPRFASNQENAQPETEPLIKSQDDTNVRSRTLINCLFGYEKCKIVLLIVCALASFAAVAFACTRISYIRYDTSFKDEQSKQPQYIIWSVGLILAFGCGIVSAYIPVTASYRSVRRVARRESRYEEI